jgi:outer membrane murein-binding lipoprotein Lpp
MKRVFLLLAVAAAVGGAIFAAPAVSRSSRSELPQRSASSSVAEQVKDLGAQVRALQRRTKALQTQVKILSNEVAANYIGDACLTALTADNLQNTWGVVDQIASAAQNKTYFGPQTAITDRGACAALSHPKVPRQPVSPTTIPSITYYSNFINWLHG